MISLSENAVRQLCSLVEQEKSPNLRVRMFVQGGGCSGFEYGFEFTDEVTEGDVEIPAGTTAMVVDPISMQYLENVSIDYKSDIAGARFVINNPEAKATCGCGSSFTPY